MAWGQPGPGRAAEPHPRPGDAGHHPAAKRHGSRGHAPSTKAKLPAGPGPAAKSPAGGATAAKSAEAVEAVEAVETVDVGGGAVAATAAATPGAPPSPTGGTPLTMTQVIAHLHPALVHLPIAWAVLWALWELLALRYAARFRPTVVVLAWFCVAAFVPATVTGLLHLQELPEAADVRAPALLHRNIIFACAASSLILAALATRWHRRGPPGRAMVIANLLALWLQVGAIGYAAHVGGKMVYGDDYLPF